MYRTSQELFNELNRRASARQPWGEHQKGVVRIWLMCYDPARNPGAGPGGGAVFTGLTASRKDTVGLGEAGGVFEQRRSAAFSVLVMSYIYCA